MTEALEQLLRGVASLTLCAGASWVIDDKDERKPEEVINAILNSQNFSIYYESYLAKEKDHGSL